MFYLFVLLIFKKKGLNIAIEPFNPLLSLFYNLHFTTYLQLKVCRRFQIFSRALRCAITILTLFNAAILCAVNLAACAGYFLANASRRGSRTFIANIVLL
jgi:hypothetical protein